MSKYKKAKRCVYCAHRHIICFVGEGKYCCDLKPQYTFNKFTRQPKWCPLKEKGTVNNS